MALICYVSGPGPTLRGRVPSAYSRVAPHWETPDCRPVSRGQDLPPADAGRSAVLPTHLSHDLGTPGSARTRVRYGPEQSASMDARPLTRAAGGTAHPRRCPRPLSDRPGPAARRGGG